ncbi:HAD domain-containing protein [Chitiniphilus purpureus]|uniref:HAD domain-containing protein n=1 Tax=Chitiniphilus purpureus TaxID=2981137 RepID=A0ABY6DUB2_9NEIS|nr:HAD domain-containing protein [Chitiniphilus sp. CD1]UXY16641.1 HAD domain-containing protein [Chitiniphilus sp. CD1]
MFAKPKSEARMPRKTSKRQVLYLDYDQVLHGTDVVLTSHGPAATQSGVALFEHAEMLDQLLRPYPAVEIVLSTSWVPHLGFEAAVRALPVEALRRRVTGSTFEPQLDDARAFLALLRGQQVLLHVKRYGIQSWLAIDDRSEGFEGCRQRLVHCQQSVGLGAADVQAQLEKRLQAEFGGS